MLEMEIYGIGLVPLLVGIIQLFKKAGLPSRYAGLAALALGIVLALAYGLTEGGWTVFRSILMGCALGLSSSGFYSNQKHIRSKNIKVQAE